MKKLTILWVALCSLILAGCGQATPAKDTTGASNSAKTVELGPIKIWVIAPLSWPAASYGADVMYGFEFAQKQINDAWGVNGREIQIISEDGKCTGKDAASAAQKLINVDKVTALMASCSWEIIAAGKIAQQEWVPTLSSIASSPEVSKVGNFVFRYWNDADTGIVLTDYIKEQGAETIALIYEGTDYAAAYANVVRQNVEADIVVEEKFLTEEKDFSILAKKIVSGSPDMLVFIPQTETTAIAMIKALEGEWEWENYRNKTIWWEVVLSKTIAAELGDLVDGMKWVTLAELPKDGAGAEKAAVLLEWFEAATAEAFTVFSADALEILAEAIESVWTDRAAIQKYIAGINAANPRDGYLEGFYFNEFGDGQGVPFVIKEFQNGEAVNVE